MSDYARRARETLDQLDDVDEGPSKVALAEECVRLADLCGDRALQLEAREELVAAGTFAGRMERSMTAFAWTLAHYEDDEWAKDEVWLGFHWVTEDAPLVSTIARAQLEQLLDQMEDVFTRNNWWLYPVHIARFRAGIVFGESAQSLRPYLDAFEREYERRGDRSAHYHHVWDVARARLGELGGRLDRAVAALDSGEQDEPPEYPHRTHAFVALMLFVRGDREVGRAHYRRAIDLCTKNQVFLREIARLLVIAELDERPDDVVRLVEQHLVWATDTWDHWSAMLWYAAAAHALRIVDGRVRPRLPPDERRFGAPDPVAAPALAEQFWADAQRLAAAFDARNGNGTWGKLVAGIRAGESPAGLFVARERG